MLPSAWNTGFGTNQKKKLYFYGKLTSFKGSTDVYITMAPTEILPYQIHNIITLLVTSYKGFCTPRDILLEQFSVLLQSWCHLHIILNETYSLHLHTSIHWKLPVKILHAFFASQIYATSLSHLFLLDV